MRELPEQFKPRMRGLLGAEYEAFISAYALPPVRGLRVNLLKQSAEGLKKCCPWGLRPCGILDEGFICDTPEGVGRHPLHAAGLFYMQEPSAMSPAALACRGIADWSGMRVLDMCAAPGGKSGALAARMGGRGVIISNEVVRSRAVQLARNLERLGAANAAVTNVYPDRIAEALPEYFDIVLVDAPCSGEGMFRKDEEAIAEWSPEHVAACAVRQKAIMDSAAECVAKGGRLVYSTCTFSPEENEGVIEDFLSKHADFELIESHRLYPHKIEGEGHFAALLIKKGGRGEGAFDTVADLKKLRPEAGADRAALEFLKDTLAEPLDERFTLIQAGDTLRLAPRETPAEAVNTPEGPRNLGFGKAVDGVMKNHLPKGLYVN